MVTRYLQLLAMKNYKGDKMKKLILVLFCLSLIIIPSFANNLEKKLNDSLNKTDEELNSIINTLKNHIGEGNINMSDTAEQLQTVINELETRNPYKGKIDDILSQNHEGVIAQAASDETVFVTGIRGGFYEDIHDVSVSMSYSYFRSSDGAVFSGTLYKYYLRSGYIGPIPYTIYYQAFYEGTLNFDYYAY